MIYPRMEMAVAASVALRSASAEARDFVRENCVVNLMMPRMSQSLRMLWRATIRE